MACLEMKNVGMSFGEERHLFRHVSYAFPSRGTFVLLGGSGTGKSTLLHLLSGNLSPSEGKVLYRGRDIASFKEKEKASFCGREVAMLFQHYELLEGETAEKNVALPLLFSGVSAKEAFRKARASLQEMGLEGKERANVSLLSGGERQRVGLCRALIHDPRVLFADEPTGALDAANGEKVISLLAEEGKKRLVIVATHDEALAARFRDKTLRLEMGELSFPKVEKESEKSDPPFFPLSRKSRGKGSILLRHLKQDAWGVALGVLSSAVAFSTCLLSIGFLLHGKEALEEEARESYGYGYAELRRREEIPLANSPLSLVRESRASAEEASALLGEDGFSFRLDLSYFLPIRPSLFHDGTPCEEARFAPSPCLDAWKKEEGLAAFVNEEFAKRYGISPGEALTVPIEFSFSCRGVKEEVREEWVFAVEGVVGDFAFLGEPRVYYSYFQVERALRALPLPGISSALSSSADLLELVAATEEDSPSRGEAIWVFAENERAKKRLEEALLPQGIEEGYSLSSPLSLQCNAFHELRRGFSSALLLFVAISLASLASLLGMNGLSCFERHRRDCALYRVLGLQGKDISSLFVAESALVSLAGLALSFFAFPFASKALNGLFARRFGIETLIEIPFLSAYGMPFFWVILGIAFASLLSSVSTWIPLRFASKRSYIEELKDE